MFLSHYLLGTVLSIAPYLASEVDVSFYVYLGPGAGLIAPWEDRTVRVAREEFEFIRNWTDPGLRLGIRCAAKPIWSGSLRTRIGSL